LRFVETYPRAGGEAKSGGLVKEGRARANAEAVPGETRLTKKCAPGVERRGDGLMFRPVVPACRPYAWRYLLSQAGKTHDQFCGRDLAGTRVEQS